MTLVDCSVILADDHPFLLKGLAEYLKDLGYTVDGVAKNGLEAEKLLNIKQSNIAILDIDMPGLTGLELAKIGAEKWQNTRFIILTYHKEQEIVAQAKKFNISGYILKEDAMLELNNCINCVLRGEFFLSAKIAHLDLNDAESTLSALYGLTPSENKILKFIADGMSSEHISNYLGISKRTVEKHRSNIVDKLQLTNHPFALKEWAIENKKLIELSN